MYTHKSKCFWQRYNVAWPFRRQPRSGRTVPTAAVCSDLAIRSHRPDYILNAHATAELEFVSLSYGTF